jgi:acyl-CoA synthetase (AMP-forming)/AMP-acid ligase II
LTESASETAIVVPDLDIRLTYRELRARLIAASEKREKRDVAVPDPLSVLLSTMAAAQARSEDREVAAKAHALARRYGLSRLDVSLCIAPLSTAGGLVSALSVFASGGTLVIPAVFNPLAFWRIARDHGVTWVAADGERLQWLLARAAAPGSRRPTGAERLRFIGTCGEALPPRLREALETAFGAAVNL